MILITTPTGQIGHQVLDLVLGGDEPIRVLARDPARLPGGVRDRVEVVSGSTDDAAVVTGAFTGVDSVFWLIPPDPRATSIQDHVLRFVRPLCAAINTARVSRVVAVSSLGRGVAQRAGQISAIFAMDDLVQSTGVDYRSLQPPGFMDNLLRQVQPLRGPGTFFGTGSPDRRIPACATRDIAAVAARLLLDDSWGGQEDIPILGPEDLSPGDMAQVMAEVLERPIRYRQVPAAAYKETLTQHGMTAAWAQGLVDMAAAAERGIYNVQPRTPDWTTATTFRQWCAEILKPAVLA